jgi:hypothetical protein
MTMRIVLFLSLLCLASSAAAQNFSGLLVGVEAGSQHLIGGALVDGVDTLQDDARLVVSAFAGLRAQARGFVIGGELGAGRTDGDLTLSSDRLDVEYRNSSQWHWALHAGHTIGSRTLLFGYLSEVTRQFDVSISQAGQSTSQQDEQGMLRFGGGLEFQMRRALHVRGTFGTSRADFGDRPLNRTIDRHFEAAAGIVFQF